MSLSVVILTRNEAKNIERCLKSVIWANEVIVVDAESEDETPSIAQNFGAKVIIHPWEGAGAQYAFAIGQAKGDWVLVVDADEEVTPELAEAVRQIVTATEKTFVGYKIKRINYALGRWLRYGGWQEWVLRLFLREKVTSPPTLHPQFQVDGRIGKLPYPLRHHMASNLIEWWQRSFRLAQIEAEVEFLQGLQFNSWEIIGAFWKFLRRLIIKGGILDGWAGFYACLQRFLYVAVKQAHLLELQRNIHPITEMPERTTFR